MKKRVLAGLMAAMVLLSLTGCGTKKSDASQPDQDPPKVEDTVAGDDNTNGEENAGNSPLSGTMEEIMEKIYEGLNDIPNCSITEVNADNAEYYLGMKDISFVRAIASEPMMSSIAHSVVLLQAEDGADIEGIKKQIKDNVDGRKWICVGVEPENILVDNIGNYVLLVMDEDATTIMKQFKSLSK